MSRRTAGCPWVARVLVVMQVLGVLCGSVACGAQPDLPGSAAGAGATSADMSPSTPTPSRSVSPSATSSSGDQTTTSRVGADCPHPRSGFDCDFQRRFDSVESYLQGRPGTVGVVLRDRRTGEVWHNKYADNLVWTASTIKLAMATDLFLRDRAGEITLSADEHELIRQMLHSSNDHAADTLWFRYAGDDHMTFNDDFRNYGMTSLRAERGYTHFYPYWGFQKCTPEDLDHLINYVLTELPPTLRDYIVAQLRSVAPDQQWGVWATGPSARPGNKDGWSEEDTGWVMNTVGFAGPDERYTLAVMNNLGGHGGYSDGRETDSKVATLLLAGRS